MKNNVVSLIAVVLALAALIWQGIQRKSSESIAFVDTARLLTSFSEAHKVNDELKIEDEKWRKTAKMKNNVVSLIAVVLALAALIWQGIQRKSSESIAFVDTARLLTSFSEAHKVNDELKIEDEKWRKTAKILEDSLKVFMDSMTVKYDNSSMDMKRKMQDELAVKNQQINNFSAASTKKMEGLTAQKMAGVYEKINAFMKEYGKEMGFGIVFGATNGSIIYGEGTSLDITNQVIEKLNKRYP